MLMKTLYLYPYLFAATAHAEPQPVSEINVEEYVGKWYEIGKLPTPRPAKLLQRHGRVRAAQRWSWASSNSCRIKLFWGLSFPWYIGGKAKAVEGEVGQFDLTLRPLTALIPFGNKYERGFKVTGKYWVLELGDDYEYALVGEPTKSNLFILSRASVSTTTPSTCSWSWLKPSMATKTQPRVSSLPSSAKSNSFQTWVSALSFPSARGKQRQL